ncbi:MAG: polysaccharide deacetylase family protein [Candidatus Reddybacter sp.]
MSRFTILMYHMICSPGTKEEAKYACPPAQFERHLRFIKESVHTPVSLAEIEAHLLGEKNLPDNAVAITIDDGFKDNYTEAFPLLGKYNIPATIFLTSGVMGGTNEWMVGRDFPKREMLNWQQVQEMSRCNINFGAHTVSHPKLTELSYEIAEQEIIQSKNAIEENLGKACHHFAYPYGLLNDRTFEIVKQSGFTLACSTRSGFNNLERDPYALHRIEVYGTDPVWKLKQKMTFGMNDASRSYPFKYYSKQLLKKTGL